MIALLLQLALIVVLGWFVLRPSIKKQVLKEHAHKEQIRLSSQAIPVVVMPAPLKKS